MSNFIYKSVRLLVNISFSVLYRLEFSGLENIPEKEAYILCSNHYGELDMFLAACRIKRIVHFMAKKELFDSKFGSFFFRGIEAYPVSRGEGDIKAFRDTLKFLKNGEIVGILAEGTRTRGMDRKEVKIKPGLALFAQKADVKILPVAVKSNQKLFSKVRVTFLKPVKLEFEKGKKYTMDELSDMSKGIIDSIYDVIKKKE
jgi:1-acyl-sn-glycerol-3-phosphate acyltransferase